MRRDRIDFDTFKTNFIDQPDGYFSVYSVFNEDYESDNIRVLLLDMICEWRMDDGKVKFVEVPFDTEEQFNALVAYLRVTADLLNKAIVERIDELKYADAKPEAEAVPFPPSGLPTLPDDVMEEIKRQAIGYELSLYREALEAQRVHQVPTAS